MTAKHAYLIIAHKNIDQIQLLLSTIDDERNDIFLHIDAKAQKEGGSPLSFTTQRSQLILVPPIKVSWGGASGIFVELNLLSAALEHAPYEYLHLISGQDLPIKTQDYIHAFFQQNGGKQYIGFDKKANESGSFLNRVSYYYPLRETVGRIDGPTWSRPLRAAEKLLVLLQRCAGVDRTKGESDRYWKGANWFSITGDFASYVIQNEAQLKKRYAQTFCADEVWLQTLIMNSPYRQNLGSGNLRYIDWERGGPYVFRSSDFDLIKTSDKLFARKFDITVDKEIIDEVVQLVMPTEGVH